MQNLPIGYPSKADSRGRARKRFQGKVYDFGQWGTLDSIKAFQAFMRDTLDAMQPERETGERLTVSELIYEWIKHERTERGEQHREVEAIKRACVPLERIFGLTLASEFDSRRLIELQKLLVSGAWMSEEEKKRIGEPWSRNYINKQVQRVRAVFRWAETMKLVPEGRWFNLRSVKDIQPNHRTVRLNQPRRPVDYEKQVLPTLPYMTMQVGAMIQIQFLTASRPGEIRQMRKNEIDRQGPHGCWVFSPGSHKNQWRGHGRHILLGPQAQAILAPFLLMCLSDDGHVFRPTRGNPKGYTDEAVNRAIERACERAGVAQWRCYDLRHARATFVKQSCGIETAKTILGHRSATMTERYGELHDVDAAARAMKSCG